MDLLASFWCIVGHQSFLSAEARIDREPWSLDQIEIAPTLSRFYGCEELGCAEICVHGRDSGQANDGAEVRIFWLGVEAGRRAREDHRGRIGVLGK